MTKFTVLLCIFSIALSSLAQIVLKQGMSSPTVLQAIASAATFPILKSIATNVFVIGGLFLYFSSAAVWLFVLAKIDVSSAYPFVGLGFILTMLLAYFIHHEPLTIYKVTGTLLITLGVVAISQG